MSRVNHRWAIAALAIAGVVIALGAVKLLDGGGGSDAPAVPAHASLSSVVAGATPASAPFRGLTEVHLGVGTDRCLRVVVADTLEERRAGLRGSPDLGPYQGMLFVYPAETTVGYTMSR
ncbi:MAG: DUF192 domain-containing protein, partial [Acidimicrobiia bacterium]